MPLKPIYGLSSGPASGGDEGAWVLTMSRTIRQAWRLPVFLGLVLLAAITTYPIVFVLFATFKNAFQYARNPLGPPPRLEWGALHEVWSGGGIQAGFVHSAAVVLSALVIGLLLASLAGFALAHLQVPLRRTLYVCLVVLMIQPPALALMPTFLVLYHLGLINNLAGLSLVYIGMVVPFGTVFMHAYFTRLPKEMFEAATVDGASAWRRFRSVALPLAGPALTTLGSLVFVWLWNEFLFAVVILQSQSTMTLVVALSIVVGERFVADFQQVAAGMLITMIPPIAVFFWLQRGLARGITAGAVK